MVKCKKCKKEGTGYTSGYCEDCYAEIWHAGFTSQADYSDELFEKQREENAEENRKINKAKPKRSDIEHIVQRYWTSVIICSKCKYKRVTSKQFQKLKKEGKLVDELEKTCPKCGTKGFLYRL